MSAHTPGEWQYREHCPYGRDIYAGNTWVADAKGDHNGGSGPNGDSFPTDDQCFANARLIAAAPDLLAALMAMVEPWNGFNDHETARRVDPTMLTAITAARAAIARATGDTP